MKYKIISVLLITTSLTWLVSCGSNIENSNNDTTSNKRTNPSIEVDNNTVRYMDREEWYQVQKEKEIENTYTEDESQTSSQYEYKPTESAPTVGELILQGEDTTTRWQVVNDGSDILYNGITFANLKSCIDKMDLPDGVSKINFINFIVKTFRTDSDRVKVNYTTDDDVEETGEIVDSSLSDVSVYHNIKYRYNNEPCYWTLTIQDINTGSRGGICGCKYYMVVLGVDDSYVVDMDALSLKDTNLEDYGYTEESLDSMIFETQEEGTTETEEITTLESIEDNTDENDDTTEESESEVDEKSSEQGE